MNLLDTPLLDRRAVARLLNCAPKTVDRLVSRGQLPAPIRFSKRSLRWHPTVIDEYLRNRQLGL